MRSSDPYYSYYSIALFVFPMTGHALRMCQTQFGMWDSDRDAATNLGGDGGGLETLLCGAGNPAGASGWTPGRR